MTRYAGREVSWFSCNGRGGSQRNSGRVVRKEGDWLLIHVARKDGREYDIRVRAAGVQLAEAK